jgi:hypothetical protein
MASLYVVIYRKEPPQDVKYIKKGTDVWDNRGNESL